MAVVGPGLMDCMYCWICELWRAVIDGGGGSCLEACVLRLCVCGPRAAGISKINSIKNSTDRGVPSSSTVHM
jgi:hypothetical protein